MNTAELSMAGNQAKEAWKTLRDSITLGLFLRWTAYHTLVLFPAIVGFGVICGVMAMGGPFLIWNLYLHEAGDQIRYSLLGLYTMVAPLFLSLSLRKGGLFHGWLMFASYGWRSPFTFVKDPKPAKH